MCVLVYMLIACRWAQICTIICLTDKQAERKTKSYLPPHCGTLQKPYLIQSTPINLISGY